MASSPTQPGKIIAFYSYKGGTGRSMALANVACLLSKRLAKTSQRVLVMDWDLEAPGLHRFFSAKSDLPEYESRPGVMNYFYSLREMLAANPDLCEQLAAPEGWRVLGQKLSLDSYLIPDVVSGVDFMRAGRFDPEYPKLVGSFNWIELFEHYGAAIRAFRELLAMTFAYTLVDSRTGLTDVSGICTTLLPEKLVGVFTPNRQSLHGLRDLVSQAIEYRSKSDDFRPLSVFPLPSRVENAEKDLREQWRKDYQDVFESLFRRLHETKQCDLTDYFNEVLLPHVSYYAYGENIAVLQERSDAISLSAAYQRFFERLMNFDFAWEAPEAEAATAAPAPAAMAAAPVAGAAPAAFAAPIPERYDAFLSYADADGKVVEQMDSQLHKQGVKTFFPLRDILPGGNWAAATSAAMAASKAIVVFVGPSGSGPWQDQESLGALENHAKDASKRIIPVLLPKAPSTEKLRLPNFLRNVQWVDLRAGLGDKQAMSNLIWALTGERPPARKLSRRTRWGIGAAAALVIFATGYFGLRSLEYRGYIGAIAKYQKLVQENPNDAESRANLGDALAKWGRTDKALEQYRQANRLGAFSRGEFGILLDMDRSKAIAWLRDTIEQAPNDEGLHFSLATLLQDDDLDGAIQELREVVRLRPKDAYNHAKLAELLEKKGDIKEALDEYQTASKLEPNNKDLAADVQR
ncbi:MAG: KGGVGR-motif variant AAA ATPase, partial [Terriglobia bacterium]